MRGRKPKTEGVSIAANALERNELRVDRSQLECGEEHRPSQGYYHSVVLDPDGNRIELTV